MRRTIEEEEEDQMLISKQQTTSFPLHCDADEETRTRHHLRCSSLSSSPIGLLTKEAMTKTTEGEATSAATSRRLLQQQDRRNRGLSFCTSAMMIMVATMNVPEQCSAFHGPSALFRSSCTRTITTKDIRPRSRVLTTFLSSTSSIRAGGSKIRLGSLMALSASAKRAAAATPASTGTTTTGPPLAATTIEEILDNRRRSERSLYSDWTLMDDDGDDDYDDNNNEDEDDDILLDGYWELQHSKGPDVLQAALQEQIDDATTTSETANGENFLSRYAGSDASWTEKVAMSTITEQLPKPAIDALKRKMMNDDYGTLNNKKKTLYSPTTGGALNYGHARLPHEKELELGRTIQKGVALHKVRTELETEFEGTEQTVTRQVWAERAGLSSTRELRRIVSDYRKAKQQLVAGSMGLVHAVVARQWAINPQLYLGRATKDEWIQEASLGLLRAAELFDPERGLRFSTYAVIWIKGIISTTHMHELVKLPDRERTKYRKIKKADQQFRDEHGIKATTLQLANVTGLKMNDVETIPDHMETARGILSLDDEFSFTSRAGTETSSLNVELSNNYDRKKWENEVDLIERTQMHADVLAALATVLKPREERFMRLRYGLSDGVERTLQECADAMGLSLSTIFITSKTCMTKLRKAADVQALDEYLMTIA